MKAVSLLLALALAACGGVSEPASDPQPASPATSAPSPAAGASTQNEGPGRPQAVSCASSAGECRSDDDCSAGAVCGCKVGGQNQNVCLTQSRCRVDADCAGRKCNLSLPFIFTPADPGADAGSYGGVSSGADIGGFEHSEGLGYFCTTPQDACVPGQPTNAIGDCVFGLDQNHWIVGSKP